MKMKFFLAAFFCFLIQIISHAQTNNAELQKMYDEDQGARMAKSIDWVTLNKHDSTRRARVYELIREGKVVTGKDYYNSAMIFQHGNDTVASAMAVKQMRQAIALDTSVNRWLLAAAIDRDLMRRNQPQIYGTQYVKLGQNAKWERYKIDSTKITDAERKYYRVESLAEQRAKERAMNLADVSDFYASSDIDKTIQFIRDQFKKGDGGTSDVGEDAINTFGYDLLKNGKKDDALRIFKLNTELYPEGFNTFDSYGETLLLLGKKEEGLKAYRRSLELNPGNDNAKKILGENK